MNFRRLSSLFLAASLTAMFAACGGGNNSTPPPQQVTLAYTSSQLTPPSSMTAGATATFAATITNGSAGSTVSWTVTCSQSSCGSFNPTSTASTTATTYTAPASVPSGGLTVTVTATYSGTGTATPLSSTITINAPASVTLAYTSGDAPPSTMTAGTTAPIAVTITNGSTGSSVNWTVTCGQSSCGTFTPTSTASTVVTTYTAPASVPSGGLSVTVTATYSGTGSATPLSSNITINPASSGIVVTINTPPPSSMNVSAQASIVATVANDSQNQGVNWTCAPVSACGTFSPSPTASGVATTYTAPATVPGTNPVTITATSVSNSNAFATASVTITPAGTVSVTLSTPPPTSMLIQGTAPVVATVANDSQNQGVTWSCAPTNLCGTFTGLSSTPPTFSATYTAPSIVPQSTSGVVTLTATSVASPSAFATASITITSNVVVSFSPSFGPPSSPVNISSITELAATTSNDPNNTLGANIVNWTVTCGSPGACGAFSPTSTGNNVQTNYTAPSAVPSGNTVTVTATSITDYTKSVTGIITIQLPPPLLPDGTYVFQISGEDTNGAPAFTPFSVAGAFTVASDAITRGEQDFADATGVDVNSIQPTGGGSGTTIAATTDGNLQIILDSADNSIGAGGNGLETLNITLTSATTGLISWFDGFATGTGTLTIQDPTAAGTLPSGGFAMLSSGYEVTNSNGTSGGSPGTFNIAIGGIPVIASGSISGFFDVNDSNAPVQIKIPFTGSVGTPDSFGRVQFTLDSTIPSTVPEILLAGYIANANQISLVEIPDAYGAYTGGGAITGGTALAQNSAATFGDATLLNTSYAFALQGDDSAGGDIYAQFAGSLTFSTGSPDLTVSGNATLNDINNQISGAIPGSPTAKVDATGRATIFGLSIGSGDVSGQIVLYLDGNTPGNALALTTHRNYVLAGPAFQQTASATVSGSYAMIGTGVSGSTLNPWSAVGPVLNINTGTIGANSFTDFNYYGETLAATPCPGTGNTCAGFPLTGTLTTTTGTITGLGADSLLTGPATSDTFDVYPIDSSHAFVIENDATQLGLLYLAPYIATPALPNAGAAKPALSTRNRRTARTRVPAPASQTAK